MPDANKAANDSDEVLNHLMRALWEWVDRQGGTVTIEHARNITGQFHCSWCRKYDHRHDRRRRGKGEAMIDELAQRAAVVAEARSWVGTPYHNCADVKGAGVDCGMLLVRVFVDLGLAEPFDPRPYPSDWHLHRGEERYLGFVFARGHEVAHPQPGDVAVFRYGRVYSHGGIVTSSEPITLVHAFAPARLVLEEPLHCNGQLAAARRERKFFSYWKPAGRSEERPSSDGLC